ncbi:nodulin MtN21 /EamA-like transporter family protein [Actinidia rufa]|uniref:Nodulin MtN21 /EamA-like transporter family protein n=1 Tax=Actinidia rufa TaxID=165716 RepID=A0A7J0FFT7_9ERIC|nr:nodulin MtN21 /EamA-like transporter family protein [Actinidia rufa]
MSSSDSINGGGGERELADAHVVELVAASTAGDSISEEQITPLLENPKINIFSVSYPRRKPNREQVTRLAETEISPFTQFFMWAWSGSSIQRLPLSQAIILSFTTPIMASIAARVILHEKLKVAEIGGGIAKAAEASDSYVLGSNLIYAVLIALFSSVTGGISYCLIRAGAKASDHPVVTVFSFGILASPASVICTFAYEVFLARGLQLEKTSRVTNILYLEAALSQLWAMGSSKFAPSFGRLVGCLLILASACCTMYIGPEKDIE